MFLHQGYALFFYAQLIDEVVESLVAHRVQIARHVGAVGLQAACQIGKREVFVQVKPLSHHMVYKLLLADGERWFNGWLLYGFLRDSDGFEVPTVVKHHKPQCQGGEVIEYIDKHSGIKGGEEPCQLAYDSKEENGFEPRNVDILNVGIVAANVADVTPELYVAYYYDSPCVAPKEGNVSIYD